MPKNFFPWLFVAIVLMAIGGAITNCGNESSSGGGSSDCEVVIYSDADGNTYTGCR